MNSLTSASLGADNTVTIVVTEVIGNTLCIASEDGAKVCEQIAAALRQSKKAIVSFKNAEKISAAFLADAIARLYALFPEEQISANLSVVDMKPDDAANLECTIQSLKDYLKDPERWKASARKAFGK